VTDRTPDTTPEEAVLNRTTPPVAAKVKRLLAERDAWNAHVATLDVRLIPAFGPDQEGFLSNSAAEAGVRVPSTEDRRYLQANYWEPVRAEREYRARVAKEDQDRALFEVHSRIHAEAEGGIVATHGPELHGTPPDRTSSEARYWAVGAHGHFHDHSGSNPTGRPDPGFTAREYSEEEAEARLTKLRVAELRRKKP
jgi:hypothetical protein